MSQQALFASALLVEDEPNLVVALEIALRKLGIPCKTSNNLRDARKAFAESKITPEFVLLDRALPDGDGIQFCEELRQSGYSGRILILTAAGEIEDRVTGLNSGADDYLPKPFSWIELEARIRALSRRAHSVEQTQRNWTLDIDRLRVLGPLGWVELTPLEFKLASRLIEHRGSIVSRDDLLKNVWGFTLLPKTRTVDHFLGRLRKHFEQNPEEPKHFLTVRGAGYRFEG